MTTGKSRGRRLLIFDCDGVLGDSEIIACQVQSEALRSYGLDMSPNDVARHFVGVASAEMRIELAEAHGLVLPDDHENRSAAEITRRFRASLRPVPGIDRVLDVVDELGDARCVASGSAPARIALSLELTGLTDRFGTSVFSATEVRQGKPAPDIFLHAADQMGIAPQDCLVVEDSAPGIQAARAAGMCAVGFTAASHCGPAYAAKLRAAGADLIAEDAEQLIRLLRR